MSSISTGKPGGKDIGVGNTLKLSLGKEWEVCRKHGLIDWRFCPCNSRLLMLLKWLTSLYSHWESIKGF
jgi:hypothetical protein